MDLLGFFGIQTQSSRRTFIENYEFSAALKSRFAASHSALEANDCAVVFRGLRQYFLACHAAGRSMVSMPSQVVDDAWHEWILFTREYTDFCDKAFGRYLHHTPAQAMPSPTVAQGGIRRAWRLCCKIEGIDARRPGRLPLLFAIDDLLNTPNGFRYSLNCLATNRDDYCASHIGCGGSSGGSDGDSGSDGGGNDSGGSDGGSSDGGGSDGGGSDGGSCGGGCGGGGD